jgi:hypothetical protein
VHPGQTVHGSFQVQNSGQNGSLLNWEINTSSISWGTWSFSPLEGQDLAPEDGVVDVQVTVIAPMNTNKEFTGYVRVENRENPLDFGLIPVNLQTPKDSGFIGSFFLTWFFERFPHMFPMVRHLLGYG